MTRHRHDWRCDTCHKFVHEGTVRCAICAFDVPATKEREKRFLARLDAKLRDLAIEQLREGR